MPELPEELRQAIESGVLTSEQIRQLIELEAKAIGLTYAEAIVRAEARSLPRNGIGNDLQLLVRLLPA
jgi:hypothetical protein